MKKCLIFFTLLLITIAIAVVLEKQEQLSEVNDVVIGTSASDGYLAEEQIAALE